MHSATKYAEMNSSGEQRHKINRLLASQSKSNKPLSRMQNIVNKDSIKPKKTSYSPSRAYFTSRTGKAPSMFELSEEAKVRKSAIKAVR